MPASCRVQLVLHGGSDLPEDRYINTFHFHSIAAEDPTVFQAQCVLAVDLAFMNAAPDGTQLHSFLSAFVSTQYELVSYDLALAPGLRVPTIFNGTATTTPTGGLPSEVAVCLSLAGDPPNNARRRGRLYLGPLSDKTAVMLAATSSVPPRPSTQVVGSIGVAMAAKAKVLMDSIETPWCIRSMTPTENYVRITRAWVDNSFDTVRKRGEKPSARWTETAG